MNLSLNSLNTDFQGLQDTRFTWDPYNTKFTGDDFGGKGVIGRDISTGVGLGTSIGAGAGAALGSTLGSWAGPAGAGLGALLGVIAGGIAGGVKKNSAEKRAESMNAANSFLNQQANNEFNNTATNIATNNWLNTMKQNSFEFGGVLNQASPYTEYNAGGSHQSNPLGGIMVGIGENGLPNKVEEGEVKYKDYVFSNKTKPSKEFQKHYKIKDKTFAEIFKTYMKAAKETENDPITKKGTEQFAKALMMEQEKVKQMEAAAQQQALLEQQAALSQNPDAPIPTEASSEVPQDANLFAPGGKLKNFFKNWGTEKNDFDPINDGNLLTMSTLIPQGISVIDSLFTQPDYSAADAIAEAGRNLSYVTPTILTDRMEYTPVDTNRYLSSLRNNAAANRNQIRDIAGANRVAAMAALQGSNRDQVTAMGELMPQLEAMNEARRNQAIQFNAGINAQNAAARAQADAHNMQVEQAKYNATLQSLAAKEAEDKLNAQQRNQNLTSFVTNLGALGTELSNAERLRYLKDNTDMFGNFKGDSPETSNNTSETTSQNAVNNNVSNSPFDFNPSNLLDINTSFLGYIGNPATVSSMQSQTQPNVNLASLIPTGPYENIKSGEGEQSPVPVLGPWLGDTRNYDHSSSDVVESVDPNSTSQSKGITTPPGQKISTPPGQKISNPATPSVPAIQDWNKPVRSGLENFVYDNLVYENSTSPETIYLNGQQFQVVHPNPEERKGILESLNIPQNTPLWKSSSSAIYDGTVSEQMGYPTTLNYMENALQLPTATSHTTSTTTTTPTTPTRTSANRTPALANQRKTDSQVGSYGSDRTSSYNTNKDYLAEQTLAKRNTQVWKINRRLASVSPTTRANLLKTLNLSSHTKIESLSPEQLQRLEKLLDQQ